MTTLGNTALTVEMPTVVSSLPGSPQDGQEVYYLADAASGMIWHLKYRASSASSHKWEFAGGGKLDDTVVGNASTSSSSFSDLGGPARVLPLDGDYLVEYGASGSNSSPGQGSYIELFDGTAVHSIGVNSDLYFQSASGSDFIGQSTQFRADGFVGGDSLEMWYRASGVGTASWTRRWLRVSPIRVG